MWREPKDVPEDLVFHINYLGTGATDIRVWGLQNRVQGGIAANHCRLGLVEKD